MFSLLCGNMMAKRHSVVVHNKSGEKVVYCMIQDEPKLSFGSGVLKLATNKVTVEYPLESFDYISFDEELLPTAVEEVKDDAQTVHFAIDGNRVEVSSANEGSWVEVYTIGGVKVASSRVQSGHANVTLGDAPDKEWTCNI
ncbi:MAG: hypothetical protein K2H04_07000 [Bacteroidaceae bacterium]|nr:hypothetical protein [Bacteroidaceae bacterium]